MVLAFPNDSIVVLLCLLVDILLKKKSFPFFNVKSIEHYGFYVQCVLTPLILILSWPIRTLSYRQLCPYDMYIPHHFLSTSLSYGTRCSTRFILYFFCLSHEISQFSNEPWFLLEENGI